MPCIIGAVFAVCLSNGGLDRQLGYRCALRVNDSQPYPDLHCIQRSVHTESSHDSSSFKAPARSVCYCGDARYDIGTILITMDDNIHHTYSKVIQDRRAVKRPDIVLIFRVRGDRKSPPDKFVR
eukprot:2960625-Pyramimonas_sp.AAC.1